MSLFIACEGLDAAGKTSVIIPYLQNKLDKEQNVFLADMKTGNIAGAGAGSTAGNIGGKLMGK